MIFKPLRLDSRSEYEGALTRFPTHSDFDFTGAFVWDSGESARYAIVNGALALDAADYHGSGRFVSFLARNRVPEIAEELLQYAVDRHGTRELRLVPDWMISDLARSGRFDFEEDADHADYLYSTEWLKTLEGKRFKGKAAKARRFETTNKPDLVRVGLRDPEGRQAILDCFHEWQALCPRDAEHVSDELRALEKLLLHAAEMPVEALGVLVGGSLIGFTVYEIVPRAGESVCIGHFQKANTTYLGATEYMMRELACRLSDNGIAQMNWEQDLGVPGLRQSKRSYQPMSYRRKFTVRLKARARSPKETAATRDEHRSNAQLKQSEVGGVGN